MNGDKAELPYAKHPVPTYTPHTFIQAVLYLVVLGLLFCPEGLPYAIGVFRFERNCQAGHTASGIRSVSCASSDIGIQSSVKHCN